MNTFAETLKELRTNKNLTQEELAEIWGIKRNTLANWETGRTRPNNNMLMDIASYFNVTTDYLLGRTDERYSDEKILEVIGELLENMGLSNDQQTLTGLAAMIITMIQKNPDQIIQWKNEGKCLLSLTPEKRKEKIIKWRKK